MQDVKPPGTPMETRYQSVTNEPSNELPNNTTYRQALGSLLYIATVSKPDIAAAVSILCRQVYHNLRTETGTL